MGHENGRAVANSFWKSRLWRRCFVVLAALFCVALFKSAAIEHGINRSKSDARLINLAGRQRMLSQRVALAASMVEHASLSGTADSVAERLERLSLVRDEFVSGHRVVATRDRGSSLRGEHTVAARAFLSELDPLTAKIRGEADGVVAAAGLPANRSVAVHGAVVALQETTDRYLASMDRLVALLAREAERKVSVAVWISRIGVIVVGVLIVIEALFVLAPAVRDVIRERQSAIEANDALRAQHAVAESLNQSLRESVALNASMFRTAADAILVLDESGRVDRANAAALEVFGVTELELVGRELVDFLGDADRERLRTLLAEGRRTHTTGPLLRGDGVDAVRKSQECFKAELSLSSDFVCGKTLYTAIVRDTTEREAMKSKLARAEKMESIGSLASGIAHEINTPMQFISSSVSYLSGRMSQWNDLHTASSSLVASRAGDQPVSGEDLDRLVTSLPSNDVLVDSEEALEDCKIGIDRVVEIISAMKDYAHPGSDDCEPFDAMRCVRNAAVITKNVTKAIATVEIDAEECDPVEGSASALNQTLVNLIVNAADAIEEANAGVLGLGRITLRTRQVGDSVEVAVSDDGCGMPSEVVSRAFDPFFTTKDMGKGSGQGLAIAYSAIVDQCGGEISISSTVGEGTTFLIRLNAARNAGGADRPASESLASAG